MFNFPPTPVTIRVGRKVDMVILTGRAAEVWEPAFRAFLNLSHYAEAAGDLPAFARELALRGVRQKIKHAGVDVEVPVISTLDDLEAAVWAVVRKHRYDAEVRERMAVKVEAACQRFLKAGGFAPRLERLKAECAGNYPALYQKVSAEIKAIGQRSVAA